MGVKGCSQAVKYLLFLFNVLILLAGLVSIALGLWIVIEKSELQKLLDTTLYTTGAYILIAAGAITVLIAALGCLGAIKEVKCMLITFFICLMLIFLLLLVGGILIFAFYHRIQTNTRSFLEDSLVNTYGVRPDEPGDLDRQTITDIWDFAQEMFDCCGVDDYTDPKGWRLWEMSRWHDDHPRRRTPESCCRSQNRTDVAGAAGVPDNECMSSWNETRAGQVIHTDGCYNKLKEALSDHVAIVSGVAVGVAVILLIGMVFAISLCKHIREP